MNDGNALWYLAGRMTGIPQFNFPRFEEVAAILRLKGYNILSPAEMDDEATTSQALASEDGAPGSGSTNGETWGDFLARDVKLVADRATGVIVMDDWYLSRGARLECFVALSCDKPIIQYSELGLSNPRREDVVRLIQENL